jgi:putative ABC transport system permease protein
VTLRALRSRFWGSLSKRQNDARLSEEIQTHLDLLAAEHVARGLDPDDARAAALREFGGVEYAKEQSRDERGFPFVESLLQDARFALRQLRRTPSFARNVAVLSTQLAERGWPGQDPIGRKFRFGVNPAAIVYEVIGTVSDVRGTSLEQPLTPTAYVPYPQRNYGVVSLIVKTSGDPAGLTSTVREQVRRYDSELPLPSFRTMDDVVGRSLSARRFQLALVAFFAVLAALLASIGVYGVTAYSVVQRSSELGIRLALGARPLALVRSVLREAIWLAAIGLLVAVPSTILGGSLLSRYLFGVTPGDPLALTATIAIVAVTALAAATGPALRATRVDPLVALRSE